MPFIVLIIVLFLNACSNNQPFENIDKSSFHGIANGNIVPFKEYKKFGAVLALQIGKGLCTASHLKGPFILTAWHCIGEPIQFNNGENIPFLIVSPSGPSTFKVAPDAYKVHLPEVDHIEDLGKDEEGKPEKLRQPDVALIELISAPKEFLDLPYAELATQNAEEENTGYVIAGYGRDSVEGPAMSGRLNAGKAQVAKADNLFIYLQWKDGAGFSTALQGDSGGPLFKWGLNGRPQVFGTVSTGNPQDKKPVDGLHGLEVPSKLEVRYTRLDKGVARNWLNGVLGK